MAKQNGASGRSVNRSQAVRDAIALNPKAGTKELIATLAAKGIKVSHTLVYYVRSKQGQARRKAKREQVAAAGNPVELVLRVKTLAREVGGIKSLKQLVDLLAE